MLGMFCRVWGRWSEVVYGIGVEVVLERGLGVYGGAWLV